MLREMFLHALSTIVQYFGMKLVARDHLQELEEDLDRMREATDEVARDMFVIIATGGPKRGTYTPVPISYIDAIPRFPDESGRRPRYSTPAPWFPYQCFVETIVPADRREVSGLVVPKSTAIALGYTLDEDTGSRTHTP